MMTPTINVQLVDFHETKGHELITENEDGTFTILINSRLSDEAIYKAYQHAVRHIERNDFEKDDDPDQIEAEVHHDSQVSEFIIPYNITPKPIKTIAHEDVPEWLKSLRKKMKKGKSKMAAYEKGRKWRDENGIKKDNDCF